MKQIFLLLIAAGFMLPLHAQKVFTKTGHVSFDATTPLEDIKAESYKVISVIEQSTGQIEFSADIKSFDFRRALMQEHFNENYMESDKYPKAAFKGNIANIKDVNLAKDGQYKVNVKGKLTIHNTTRDVDVPGIITVKDGMISGAKADFNVATQDYNIEIPGTVKDKIAKTVNVSVDMAYQALKK
jgi:polyisoprenoid-binding protein YceI